MCIKCRVTVVCDKKWTGVAVDEGCLRFYLRGRPINLYAPTAVMSSYQAIPVAVPPRQKLALEWVYPLN